MARPLQHHRIVSACSFVLLFIAFVLFLLVALSLPIIKTVYLLSLKAKVAPGQPATSIGTELRFGVWGVCVNSALDVLTLFNGNGNCTKAALGYTIPTEYLTALGVSTSLVSLLLRAVTILLVLHPVAAGLALVTFLQSLFLGTHGVSIVALITCLLTAIVSSVTLAADIALVVVAKGKLKDLANLVDFEVAFGNAVWMIVVAVALTWIAVVFLSARACYCCGVRTSWQEASHLTEKGSAPMPMPMPMAMAMANEEGPVAGAYGSEQQSTAHGTAYEHEPHQERVGGAGGEGDGYPAAYHRARTESTEVYTLREPQYAGPRERY
ncbi:hypothetical protein FIBSPDRAFT_852648 [Athelia psychrophila]|uniref:Pali-domain-containing protein n=1 Tax=Athelia psychrophila TaxID=1759441 RepID=A0A166RPN0_9AGAM|nr:hypothetical protein FIBSPDRAFT_852648 [Fibularhizoctonia sp. CBS 109695]